MTSFFLVLGKTVLVSFSLSIRTVVLERGYGTLLSKARKNFPDVRCFLVACLCHATKNCFLFVTFKVRAVTVTRKWFATTWTNHVSKTLGVNLRQCLFGPINVSKKLGVNPREALEVDVINRDPRAIDSRNGRSSEPITLFFEVPNLRKLFF
jgi:hypothetical protein